MPKGIKILLKLLIICAALYLLAMIVLFVTVRLLPGPSSGAANIVVLGAQVKEDGTLSRQLRDRLNVAYRLWSEKPDRMIYVCGGQGKGEPVSEGDAMGDYLMSLGVPDSQILRDTTSKNTRENLINAIALMEDSGAETVVVTSEYHALRALLLARELGLNATVAGSATEAVWFFKNYGREILGLGKYTLQRLGVMK